MLQILLTLLLFLVILYPFANYVYKITTFKKTFFDKFFNPIENKLYQWLHIQPENMSWKKYAYSLLIVNALLVFIGYIILRIQSLPIFNPNNIGNMEASLSFNTIISFMTNTNLQHYAGESGLSYLSQMLVIIMMMFTSAASGYSACVAMIRGMLGKPMGNFYVDFIRIIMRVLLPFSFIIALLLVTQGTPATFNATVTATTIENKYQDIALGPVAALESIKHLGTNGGGFFGANSATPFENPTIIANIIELFSMMLLPASCVVVFGHMVHDKFNQHKSSQEITNSKPKRNVFMGSEGRTIFIAMTILLLIGLGICYYSEQYLGLSINDGTMIETMANMEGKETRFGIAQSSLFTTITTSFTTGTVNNMHDSLTPLGGLVPLLHMMMNVVFGGAGVGLMNMLVYAIIAVFICGLMIGRTPEYLGKKIEGKEMKLAALCIIIHPLLILAFSALALMVNPGVEAITNPSFHGLTQVLYEFSSSAANNGSGFEGLLDNSLFWNVSCGIVMFLARYLPIIIQLAIAGNLMSKIDVNQTVGTLKTNTVTFAFILVIVVYIFSALTFLPSLALGPIAEFLTL